MLGLEQSLGSRIVTYADDLVILCRRGKAEEALSRLREIMGKLKLTVNEGKTRICEVPEGEFDFLGYTFGLMYSAKTGKAYLGYRPSKKSIKRMVETTCTDGSNRTRARHHRAGGEVEPHAARMGELLQCRHRHQSVSGDRQLHRCVVAPVVTHQAQGQATQGRDLFTLAVFRARTPNRAWPRPAVGEGVRSCPRAGCGRSACPVRRAGCGNGDMATPVRHRQTKEAETDMCSLKPPRHIPTPPDSEYLAASMTTPLTLRQPTPSADSTGGPSRSIGDI